jgi:hypothetical protein
MEPHLFYKGKEIGVVFAGDVQIGKGSCRAIVENEPTHKPHNMVGNAKWSRVECKFPMVRGWDKKGEDQKDIFKMAENPGEYEFKLLWNNKLARSIKFTVGPDGNITFSSGGTSKPDFSEGVTFISGTAQERRIGGREPAGHLCRDDRPRATIPAVQNLLFALIKAPFC